MNYEKKQSNYELFTNVIYYVIIGFVSVIATFVLPFMGTAVGLQMKFPDTTAGWLVYISSKLFVAGINILLFHCFMRQGKINIKDNEKYKEADKILEREFSKKHLNPKGPEEWQKGQYIVKGIAIFITSVFTAISLTEAILTFDFTTFLTYAITILMGLVFGFLQMKKAEDYWTCEYWHYAMQYKAKKEEEQKKKEELDKLPPAAKKAKLEKEAKENARN